MDQQMPASAEEKTSQKTSRHPVERAIVWVVIILGVSLVAYESRAKFGYDKTLKYIQSGVDAYNAAGDGKNAPELRLSDVKKNLSGGPSLSEIEESNLGQKAITLRWSSLFKTYELRLVLNNNTEEAIVFDVKPTVAE